MRFLLGLIIGIVLVPVCMYVYIRQGYAPVATAAAPFPLERKLAHMALNARIEKEAPKTPGVPADEANLLAGAKLYREHCAVCHGMSDGVKTATAKGMFPKPPLLLHGKGVTDDPAGETYWKVSNGIRLTGMPAYRDSLSETQMWQISQLLASEKLPASVTDYLAQPPPAK
jgi:mono/diheme cytochrome c family protein